MGHYGDGPFVSVPLFLVMTTGKQGDRHERTVPLCSSSDRFIEFPLSEISLHTIICNKKIIKLIMGGSL